MPISRALYVRNSNGIFSKIVSPPYKELVHDKMQLPLNVKVVCEIFFDDMYVQLKANEILYHSIHG